MCYLYHWCKPRIPRKPRFKRAQASLEVLLILAAMFAALALFLPAITYSLHGFFAANDSLIAKHASDEIGEYSSLLFFLGDGSQKTFYYTPSGSIEVFSRGSELVFVGGEKYFYSKTGSVQVVVRKSHTTKFGITLGKKAGAITVSVFDA